MTITWHIVDLNLTHSDKYIIYDFIQWTKETYEDVTKLNPLRGKIHGYLCITLDYTTSRKVKMYMK